MGLEDRPAVVEERERLYLSKEEDNQAQLLGLIAEAERKRKTLERQRTAAKKSQSEAEEQFRFVKELSQSLLANRREIRAPTTNSSAVDAEGTGTGAPVQSGVDTDPLLRRLRER